MPKFLEVTDKAAARDAVEVYSRAQIVGPGDDLPIESGFWWLTEPVAVDGRVFVGTCSDDRGAWLQEWTQPVEGGPFWLHRYFMGFVDFLPAGTTGTEAEPYSDNDDWRSDHAPATLAIKTGKPLLAFWMGQAASRRIYYRRSTQNVEDAKPAQMEFEPVQTHGVDGSGVTYPQAMINGDDVWLCHRMWTDDYHAAWSLTKFGNWATETPVQYDVFGAGVLETFYVKSRIVNGVMRCLVTGHPSFSTANKVWWCEINLSTGSITKADGTVLGNLDGTNLPLAKEDLEVVQTSSGSNKPWGFDVGYGATREIVFTDGQNSNFAATGKYKYGRYSGGSWSVSEISSVGHFLSSTTGAYFPSIQFSPNEADSVVLARGTGTTSGMNYIERYSTSNGGATWALAEVIDSSAVTFPAGVPRAALTRAYPVRVESGESPFEVIGTDIRSYPAFWRGWEMYVRPLPLSHPVKRVPVDESPVAVGLRTENTDPAIGLAFSGQVGAYIEGPADVNVPAEGCRIEVDVALDNWSPTSEVALLSKESAADERELRLVMAGTGPLTRKIGVYWSEDGTTASSLNVNGSVPAVDGQRIQIAMEFATAIPNPTIAGAMQRRLVLYYRFRSDEAWTTFAVFQSGPSTTIFASEAPWEIGSRRLGQLSNAQGVFYRASVYDLNGALLTEWRADTIGSTSSDWTVKLPSGATTEPRITRIVDSAGNTVLSFSPQESAVNYWSVMNAASGGAVGVRTEGPGADVPFFIRTKGVSGRVVLVNTDGNPAIRGIGSVTDAGFVAPLILEGSNNGRVLIGMGNSYNQVLTQKVDTLNTAATLGSVSGHRYVVLLKSGAAPTLPTAVNDGRTTYVLKNTTSSPITVSTTSSQTINGEATFSLGADQAVELVSDNANWFIV